MPSLIDLTPSAFPRPRVRATGRRGSDPRSRFDPAKRLFAVNACALLVATNAHHNQVLADSWLTLCSTVVSARSRSRSERRADHRHVTRPALVLSPRSTRARLRLGATALVLVPARIALLQRHVSDHADGVDGTIAFASCGFDSRHRFVPFRWRGPVLRRPERWRGTAIGDQVGPGRTLVDLDGRRSSRALLVRREAKALWVRLAFHARDLLGRSLCRPAVRPRRVGDAAVSVAAAA
jgi:hypothetical protein